MIHVIMSAGRCSAGSMAASVSLIINGRLSQAESIKILDPGKKTKSKLIVDVVTLMLTDIFIGTNKAVQILLLKRPVC